MLKAVHKMLNLLEARNTGFTHIKQTKPGKIRFYIRVIYDFKIIEINADFPVVVKDRSDQRTISHD